MSEQKSSLTTPSFLRRETWGEANTAAVSIPSELGLEQISHSYEGNMVLDGVSLTADSGTVTCLLGPSGSGKSTLLRIAAGMVRQSAGSVLLDGQTIAGGGTFLPPEKRGIGLVFQDYALFPHLSLLRNVMFGLKHLKTGQREPMARQMLQRVGLEHRALDFPHQLSGGEQQRVALARAMAPRPGVLLMDEPFSGLDSRLRDNVREETLGVLRETRATSLIVTHDPEEALRMGDQIALLHSGRLEQVGTGHELYHQPNSLFTAGFFSELNIFQGRVENGTVDTPLGSVDAKGISDGHRATIAMRLASLTVSKQSKRKASGISGRIISARFTGDFDYLTIGVSGAETPVRARVPAGTLSAAALEGREGIEISIRRQGVFAFAE